MKEKIKRYNPKLNIGLTASQVEERHKDNLVNFNTDVKTKSAKEIIIENSFTLFNIINIILAIAIIAVGSYKNLTFIIIIVLNTVISTFQELRSKYTIDKLSVVSEHKIKVIRDGKTLELSLDEIVLDDIVKFTSGNQIVVDSIIQDGEVLVDESFITGEEENILKKNGDMLLSGSFIVSGNCICKVEHIGYDNYTAKISSDTKYIKEVSSEIMRSLNKIVKTISFVIVPLGVLLFARQLFLPGNTFESAVVNTVAALIGMIPEGLVLLTSTVFAVSVIRLSRKKVLVQDLYCIETLARVNVICLDKTGTITEGIMEVKDTINKEISKKELEKLIGNVAHTINDENPTARALKTAFSKAEDIKYQKIIPFNSATKYSGLIIDDKKRILIGAPEFVMKNYQKNKNEIDKLTSDSRVVAVVEIENWNQKDEMEKLLGYVLIQDKIRKEAARTIQYFKDQGVKVKIISGDNKLTVLNIAKRAKVGDNLKAIDLSTLKSEEEIRKAALEYDVFGRVKPEEKHILIKALKEAGNTVAMTGDGVNDCLALKEADCSIAMASGTDAARSVSQLVLLDSNFDAMPSVVLEGRRSINNLQRSASLFLVKTIYAGLLAFIFLFLEESYPFIPVQLTLSSIVTIGIPSFILALEPNKELVKGSFLINVLKVATPPALVIVINIVLITLFGNAIGLTYAKVSTLSLTITAYTSFILLYKVCQPFNRVRLILFGLMFYLFIYAILNLTTLFSITHFDYLMIFITFILMFSSHQLYKLFEYLSNKFFSKIKI
ncbi:MAG TPA: HAD-IC family P-type ATPase [Candidatus Onthousia faecavium]|nr:HAD-IC family P-type ATPase [Candidatus Onthousia faecavium]